MKYPGSFFTRQLTRVAAGAGLVAPLALAGCAGVSDSREPSAAFTVPISVQEAYDRAMVQANYCLLSDDSAPIESEMAPDGQWAHIQLPMRFTGTVTARVDMKALAPEETEVEVRMWNVSIWDQTAADAMEAAIRFGVPGCINYFPGTQPRLDSRSRK